MPLAEGTDEAFSRQLPQSVQGESKVGVPLYPGVIEYLTAVGFDQIRDSRIPGYQPETRIASANGMIKGFLTHPDYARTRYQYQTTVR